MNLKQINYDKLIEQPELFYGSRSIYFDCEYGERYCGNFNLETTESSSFYSFEGGHEEGMDLSVDSGTIMYKEGEVIATILELSELQPKTSAGFDQFGHEIYHDSLHLGDTNERVCITVRKSKGRILLCPNAGPVIFTKLFDRGFRELSNLEVFRQIDRVLSALECIDQKSIITIDTGMSNCINAGNEVF